MQGGTQWGTPKSIPPLLPKQVGPIHGVLVLDTVFFGTHNMAYIEKMVLCLLVGVEYSF